MKPITLAAGFVLITALAGCGGAGGGVDAGSTADLMSAPACALTCTAFAPNADCYCQTTCRGPVQIFTCLVNGATETCTCQGSGANPSPVVATCASMTDAQMIYAACFP